MRAAKTFCLLLLAAYCVCLAAVVAQGTMMDYGMLVGLMGYMQAFLRFAPAFVGLVLGMRPPQ